MKNPFLDPDKWSRVPPADGQVFVYRTASGRVEPEDQAGGTGDEIVDADGDTKIQVEESSDEDIIRFDTAGTERITIGATGITVINGPVWLGASAPVADSGGTTRMTLGTSSPHIKLTGDVNLTTGGLSLGDPGDVHLQRIEDGVLGLYDTASPGIDGLQLHGSTTDIAAATDSNKIRLFSKLVGSSQKLMSIDSSGRLWGPLGDSAQPWVFGPGSIGGLAVPQSTTWTDGLFGRLAPAGSWTASGTPSIVDDFVSGTNGPHILFTSGATSGNDAGAESAAKFARIHNYNILVKIALPTITSIRCFVGLIADTLANAVGSDTPTANHTGLQFSTARGDTNWIMTTDGAFGNLTRDTGAVVTAGAGYWFSIRTDILGGTPYLTLYSNGFTPLDTWTPSILNQPSSTTAMRLVIGIETLTGAARTLELYNLHYFGRI